MRACIRVLHMKHGVWRLAFARGGDGVDRVVVMMTVMVMVVGPRVIAMGCGDLHLREEVMVVVVMMRVVVMVVGLHVIAHKGWWRWWCWRGWWWQLGLAGDMALSSLNAGGWWW